eukprot:9793139-Karenia_brevis.AAC.1
MEAMLRIEGHALEQDSTNFKIMDIDSCSDEYLESVLRASRFKFDSFDDRRRRERASRALGSRSNTPSIILLPPPYSSGSQCYTSSIRNLQIVWPRPQDAHHFHDGDDGTHNDEDHAAQARYDDDDDKMTTMTITMMTRMARMMTMMTRMNMEMTKTTKDTLA